MGEVLTTEDIRWSPGWREALEEKQAYEKQRREIEEERERKARAPAEKQQPAAPYGLDELVAVIDERVRGWFDYYFDDAYEQREGNDRRGCYFDKSPRGWRIFADSCAPSSRAPSRSSSVRSKRNSRSSVSAFWRRIIR